MPSNLIDVRLPEFTDKKAKPIGTSEVAWEGK